MKLAGFGPTRVRRYGTEMIVSGTFLRLCVFFLILIFFPETGGADLFDCWSSRLSLSDVPRVSPSLSLFSCDDERTLARGNGPEFLAPVCTKARTTPDTEQLSMGVEGVFTKLKSLHGTAVVSEGCRAFVPAETFKVPLLSFAVLWAG